MTKKTSKRQKKAFVSPYKDLTVGATWDNKKNQMVPQNLTLIYDESNVDGLTLAFITSESPTDCLAAWGGYADYSVKNKWGQDDIAEFQQNGGNVTISFGGAAGNYLESACNDENLEDALNQVIETYNVTNLDFDIEGANIANKDNINKLAGALYKLQQSNPEITVSLTLPVLPTGLDDNGLNALKIFANPDQTVSLNQVNIMAMDYGQIAAPDPANMGPYAIQAAQSTYSQLQNIFPDKSPEALWEMIGITPMIGINDDWYYPPGVPERFTLDDAKLVSDFARAKGCKIGYWSNDRDRPCPQLYASPTCSGELKDGTMMQQNDYDFAKTFTENLQENIDAIAQKQQSSNLHAQGIQAATTILMTALPALMSNESNDKAKDNTNFWIAASALLILPVTFAGLYVAKEYGGKIKDWVSQYTPRFWKSESKDTINNENPDLENSANQTLQA